MEISVAIATHNGAPHLRAQLDSIAAQTMFPRDLVLSDDASTDTTLEIAEGFAQTAPFPVRIFRNAVALGIRDNFLNAARRCEAPVVAFCDQDDVWLPEKIYLLAGVFEDRAVSLAVHSAFVADAEMRRTGQRFPAYSRTVKSPALRTDPYFLSWGFSMAFKKSVLPVIDYVLKIVGARPEAERLYHDRWVHMLAPAFGGTVQMRDDLAIYRQHAGNVVGAPPPADRMYFRDGAKLYHNLRAKQNSSKFQAECLLLIANGNFDLFEDQARAGARYWDRVSRTFAGRADLYGDQLAAHELWRAFLNLLAQRGYRTRSRGGLGLTSLVRDVLHLFGRAARPRIGPCGKDG